MNFFQNNNAAINEHQCQLKEGSWFSMYFGEKMHCFSKYVKKWTIVNERSASYSLCFRTKASVKTEIERQIKLDYFIIHPFSYFRFLWETFMILVYISAFLFLPFEACNIFYAWFNPALLRNYGVPLVFFHLIFIMDMILNFFTGYVETKRKKIVLNHRQIIFKYLKTYFIFDVISTVPALINGCQLYFGRGYVSYPRTMILNLTKISRLHTSSKYTGRFMSRYGWNGMVFKIIEFLMRSVLFFHWAACLLFIIPFTFTFSEITAFSANTWIHSIQANILTKEISEFYLESLFTAINLTLSCATTRRPNTMNDFITAAVYAVLGILYNCYLFIKLLDIIRSIMEPETKYDEFITQLRDYMRHNQLPSNIQQRMYLFYEHRYQRIYFREESIMTTLSERMCHDINDFGRQMMVAKSKILSALDPVTVDDLMKHFILKVYLPKDTICKARTQGRYVYFISSGTVAEYTVSGKEVCHLYDGDYFGELTLLMKDHKMISNVSALEICEVYQLDRERFIRAVATKPNVFDQMLEQAKHRLKVTKAIEAAQRSAYGDGTTSHHSARSDMILA